MPDTTFTNLHSDSVSVGTLTTSEETLTIDFENATERLERAWREAPFPRLAGTAADVAGVADNPYWDIIRLTPQSSSFPGDVRLCVEGYGGFHFPTLLRHVLVRHYAWSIPSPGDILWLEKILDGRGVVEIGAGSGYWAWQLRQRGIEVVAVDNRDWGYEWEIMWSPVDDGGISVASYHPDKALMLIWPPYGSSMAWDALGAYDGDLVIYAGEGEGGCTGDDAFHRALVKEWEEIGYSPVHPTYDGIHCDLRAYRRKTPRNVPRRIPQNIPIMDGRKNRYYTDADHEAWADPEESE